MFTINQYDLKFVSTTNDFLNFLFTNQNQFGNACTSKFSQCRMNCFQILFPICQATQLTDDWSWAPNCLYITGGMSLNAMNQNHRNIPTSPRQLFWKYEEFEHLFLKLFCNGRGSPRTHRSRSLRDIVFWLLSNWKDNDRSDSFLFGYEPNRIPLGSWSKGKLSLRSLSS